jgi:hypothetical protein
VLRSQGSVPLGESVLRFQFTPGAGFKGKGELFINAEKSTESELAISPAVVAFGVLEVGKNSLSPVSQDYANRGTFAFPEGELKKVVFNVTPLVQPAKVAASQPTDQNKVKQP